MYWWCVVVNVIMKGGEEYKSISEETWFLKIFLPALW